MSSVIVVIKEKEKERKQKKVIHESKHYTTMSILTIHGLQQNQSIQFLFVHMLYTCKAKEKEKIEITQKVDLFRSK
jgi:hypothetical protein